MNLSDSWAAKQPAIARISAAEAVLGSLRGAIEDGHLPIGSRLPAEATLAAQYGVSRSVVREALRSSQSLGLTETKTGKGTYVVASRTSGDLALGRFSARALMEARPHIEVPAAALAADRRGEDDLETLRGILTAMATEDDPQQWVALDADFHAAVAHASGNPVFEQIITGIRDGLSSQSETINLMTGRQRESDDEHRAVFDAIERHDGDGAAAAMGNHLAHVASALQEIFGTTERTTTHGRH
ncbi:FadR/GntR family transcriptional regulator [Arthrobacter sp. 35W]|uniref:FadR/GntR family transcriptional regulator n=1 Tax=Arthrobacter sp. 35W TaxID=1132441 RepID=UPI000421D371|nr:FadR/GntR family transcriptional regulator [Arthrobacter sp. 35W]